MTDDAVRPPARGGGAAGSARDTPLVRPAPDDTRFGIAHALIGWLAAFVFSTIAVGLLAVTLGYADVDSVDWPLWLTALSYAFLSIGFVSVAVVVSRVWGTGDLKGDYRLAVRWTDVVGFPLGIAAQLALVPLLYRLLWFIDTEAVSKPAEELTARADGLGIALLVAMVVVLAPIVEELFFRGLVLRAFQGRFDDGIALVGSAVLFAVAHLGQVVQFPALVMFGLLAGLIAQRVGRLGPAIFFHMGFNAATVLLLTWDRT